MAYTEEELKNELKDQEYKYGFTSNIESEVIPKGLNEDVVRLISSKKNEPQWLLDFRLKAFANWKTMTEQHWAHVNYPAIDFQDISYYAAPKTKKDVKWEDVDPEMKATMDKLGISMDEQKALS
ncbi:MAG TPA: Fe-S cluster assembly protein SufB, partial [Vicingus sp.]|nr:Fe-S cluster assembly protein SufB [Vicingus sp.]